MSDIEGDDAKKGKGGKLAGLNDDDGGDFEEREMSCGWCLIPLSDLANHDSTKTYRQGLKGGSPFSGVKIKSEEISTRRHGWRNFIQKFTSSSDIESELSFTCTPFGRLSNAKQSHVALLPSTIICAMSWVPLIRVFRE